MEEPRLFSPIEATVPPGLDARIRPVVEMLYRNGIRTFESCEGGARHCTAEPWVRFRGTTAEAFHAMSVVLCDPSHQLRPYRLEQAWDLFDGWPDGPVWYLRFYPIDADTYRTWNGLAPFSEVTPNGR